MSQCYLKCDRVLPVEEKLFAKIVHHIRSLNLDKKNCKTDTKVSENSNWILARRLAHSYEFDA
jgi:hypothetical protein